ncbi:MAG TPA: response regulator [Sphingomonas sp.]
MSAKIIVVDDETQIRRLLRAVLTRGGYQVVEATDGRAAVSLLAIERPDLVLLDLGLPDQDGLELVGRLAAAAPVLVVSAREAVEEKVAALDLAAYNFARRLKTLSGLTPYEYIAKIWTSEPDRFIVNPIHQMPGLNT